MEQQLGKGQAVRKSRGCRGHSGPGPEGPAGAAGRVGMHCRSQLALCKRAGQPILANLLHVLRPAAAWPVVQGAPWRLWRPFLGRNRIAACEEQHAAGACAGQGGRWPCSRLGTPRARCRGPQGACTTRKAASRRQAAHRALASTSSGTGGRRSAPRAPAPASRPRWRDAMPGCSGRAPPERASLASSPLRRWHGGPAQPLCPEWRARLAASAMRAPRQRLSGCRSPGARPGRPPRTAAASLAASSPRAPRRLAARGTCRARSSSHGRRQP